MAFRAQWNEQSVYSDCPTCLHLGPHKPDALAMLTCDVCSTTFPAGPADAPAGEAGTYADTRPSEAITSSWVPKFPEHG